MEQSNLILMKLLYDMFNSTFSHGIFNLFNLALVLNTISVIFQTLGVYLGYLNGYFYFYAADSFEIIIGLFLWIFEEDDLRFLIRIKTKKSSEKIG